MAMVAQKYRPRYRVFASFIKNNLGLIFCNHAHDVKRDTENVQCIILVRGEFRTFREVIDEASQQIRLYRYTHHQQDSISVAATWCDSHKRRSSVNVGGQDIFAGKCMYEKLTRSPAKARGGRPYETGSRNMAATPKMNFLTLVSYSLLQTLFR